MKTNPALDWLLEKQDPGVRFFALRDLLGAPADDAQARAPRRATTRASPVKEILQAQKAEGWWVKPGPGYAPKYTGTLWQVIFLGQFGADRDHPPHPPRRGHRPGGRERGAGALLPLGAERAGLPLLRQQPPAVRLGRYSRARCPQPRPGSGADGGHPSGDPARDGVPLQPRSGRRRLPDGLLHEAQRKLVQVWLPDGLRHRRAAGNRSAHRPRPWA